MTAFEGMDVTVTVITAIVMYLIGRRAGGRRAMRGLGGGKEPQAVCGCGDHISFHKDGTGACFAEHKRTLNSVQSIRRCTCLKYTGPEPLPQVIA